MIIKFDCPGCGLSLDGEDDLQFSEVTCPTCQNVFFPKPVKTLAEKSLPPEFLKTPAGPAAQEKPKGFVGLVESLVGAGPNLSTPLADRPKAPVQTPAEKAAWEAKVKRDERDARIARIEQMAWVFTIIAAFSFVLGIGFFLSGCSSSENNVAGFIAGGSLTASAFWLFLIAQILHIRANTKK